MHALAAESAPQLAIFNPYPVGTLDFEACSEFHQAFPSVALLPYGIFPQRCAREVLRLAQFGVRTVVQQNIDDHRSAFRLILTEALLGSVAGRVLAELEDLIPEELMPVMRYLLLSAHRPVTPAELAKVHFTCEKTLRDHLGAAGLPPTYHLIVWARLFYVAHLLDDPGRTVENVASSLGFASHAALGSQLKRYLEISPSELRCRGGLQFLLKEFRCRHHQRDCRAWRVRDVCEEQSRSGE